MTQGDPAQPANNSERRAAARDKARALREAHRKQERRRKAVVRSTVIALVVAAAAVVAVVIVSSIHTTSRGPANMASDGILIGTGLKAKRTPAADANAKPVSNKTDASSGKVSIVTYVDYLCPYCGTFERTNAAQIGKLVKSGAATVEIHPIPLLASHSAGTKYSLRADNAAACLANYAPDSFWTFNRELFENQPEENTAGLTNQQLKSLVKKALVAKTSGAKAGTSSYDSVSKCIDEGRYDTWAQNALDRTLTGPIPNSSVKQLKGTPLVLVNGKQYQGALDDADEFRSFIVKAQADTYSTPTPTPTPTGSPSPTATNAG